VVDLVLAFHALCPACQARLASRTIRRTSPSMRRCSAPTCRARASCRSPARGSRWRCNAAADTRSTCDPSSSSATDRRSCDGSKTTIADLARNRQPRSCAPGLAGADPPYSHAPCDRVCGSRQRRSEFSHEHRSAPRSSTEDRPRRSRASGPHPGQRAAASAR
jgi:hypothetical protein